MMSVMLPKIRRGAIRLGVTVGVAVALTAGTVTMSQAADSSQVTYSAYVPGSYRYFGGLTPDRIYAATSHNGAFWSAPVSSDLKLGTWQSVLPVRSTFAFSASAGRAIMTDDTGTILSDRGKQVETLTPLADWGTLSGSWYMADGEMVSLDGTVVDVSKYNTYQTQDDVCTEVVSQYGSLFLVETAKCVNGFPESVQLTVRDAANSGKVVGKVMSPQPPAGAMMWGDCTLQPGEVDCLWTQGGSPRRNWVTRTNYLTGKTSTVALPVPSEVRSVEQQAGGMSLAGYSDNYGSDGVVVLDFYANLPFGHYIYAYSLDDPSHMVRVDGSALYATVNNRVVVADDLPGDGTGDGKFRVAELPFGGDSAPHVIGVMGTKNTVSPAAPLKLDLDVSKPLKAGMLSIADPLGTIVATLTTPASTDGSLRGLSWTPPAGASGEYAWTLNATDSAGKAAVNTVGDGPARGTFMVKGCTQFTDVPASNTFAASICWASATGITKGTGDGSTYSPSNPVNRGSMAAFLYRLAGSPKWDPPTTSPFVDVKTTDLFYSSITWLYSQKVTVGTMIDGKLYYQPNNAVNRGSMAAFLYRLSGSPKWSDPTTSPFTDLTSSHTFYHSITWLADQKITVGTMVNGKLVYQPGNSVNRGSMAAFMSRLSKTELQCVKYPTAVGC